MPKLQLAEIGIYVKDLKAARAFYTKKVGLKVRSSMPKWGYLALGATKGGEDAALDLWAPSPEWGQADYESRLKLGHGDRLPDERPQADDRSPEEEGREGGTRQRLGDVRALHGS